jgi:hypothetical protein
MLQFRERFTRRAIAVASKGASTYRIIYILINYIQRHAVLRQAVDKRALRSNIAHEKPIIVHSG